MATKSYWSGQNLNFFDDVHNASFPSGVWADAPILAALCDMNIAHLCAEDWTGYSSAVTGTTLAGYIATQATAGAVILADAVGGVLQLDSASATQHQGIQIQKTGEAFKPAAGKDIWFECAFSIDDTYDKVQLFAGLGSDDTTIMPSGVMDSTNANYIGFGIPTTGAGTGKLYGCKATAEGTVASAFTIAEGTTIKLGFKVNGVTSIEFWVDGVKNSSTLLTANIPIVELKPTFVCQSDGTNDPIMNLDWFRVLQIR